MARVLGFLFLFIAQITPQAIAVAGSTEADAATHRYQSVLVLNSYDEVYAWTAGELRGIRDVLSRRSDIRLRIEYMDTKNINTPEYFEQLRDLYATKYRDFPLDLIIATDDDALRFLRAYRDTLFPRVPVVFSGINNFGPKKVEGFDLYTGVGESADFASNMRLALELHPKTKRIFVISDDLTTGRTVRREFESAAVAFQHRVEFSYLTDLSMSQLQEKLRALGSDSLVFYITFFRDATGASFTPEEALPIISEASKRPVYGTTDFLLGHGIVGGMLRSSFNQGAAAGELALRVLQGEPVESIPVITESPNDYMFDYHQLDRFDIPLRQLPVGSIIINEPETFYYKYKKLIWTVLLLFVALVAYIVVLLFSIKKRIRAQKGLQAIIDSAASFLNIESYEKMKSAVAVQLRAMLPAVEHIDFFKPAFNPSDPAVWSASADADKSPDSGSLGGDGKLLGYETAELFGRSALEKRSAFSSRELVAYLNSAVFPENLVYVRGKTNFDDLDRDLAEIFSSTVSLTLETIEKHKIQESLETARQIQMSMLPKLFDSFSQENSVDLFAFLIPAKEVGGDLYDFFSIDDDHICVTVGDVSDKGVPAALFMAMAKTLVRSAAEGELEPSRILQKVSKELQRDNTQAMFVTGFLGILNKKTRRLRYANGGHNPPYLVNNDGRVSQLEVKPGTILGAFPNAQFVSEETQLNPGDGLFIYSDGVTEARSTQGALYEEERLETALEAHASDSAQAIVEAVIDDVRDFAKDATQSDDITCLFVRTI